MSDPDGVGRANDTGASDKLSARYELPGLATYSPVKERLLDAAERGLSAAERRRFYLRLAADAHQTAVQASDPYERRLYEEMAARFRAFAERPRLTVLSGDGPAHANPPQPPLLRLHVTPRREKA